jgi:hypothetical protein
MAMDDSVLQTMTEYFEARGVPVMVRHVNKGYSIIHESGVPVARFRPKAGEKDLFEVCWWKGDSSRWSRIGDFGGMIMGLEDALEYVLSDPEGLFWMAVRRDTSSIPFRTSEKRGLLAMLARLFGLGR